MNHQKRILVVDDEHANASVLEDFLKDKGFDVALAHTAKDGFDKLKTMHPDLVILDLYLPDMSGSDLCSHIRNNPVTQNVPIILCTAKPIDHSEKMRGFASGVDDFLIKPFQLSELLARVNAILRRSHMKPKADLIAEIDAVLKPKTKATPSSHPNRRQTDRMSTPPPKPAPTPTPSPVPAPPKPAPQKESLFDDNLLEEEAPVQREPLRFFHRVWNYLNHPKKALKEINEHNDFLISLIVVLGTPIVASLSQLTGVTKGFDSWISTLSLGLASHAMVWMATAGVIQMIVPFHGKSISAKEALIIGGLGTAPRLVGAVLSSVYAFLFSPGLQSSNATFSAGINLIPGLPSVDWISFISRIGVFDLWSVYLIALGFWNHCGIKEKKWGTTTWIVGVICLIFGFFSTY